jgi:TolB protein
VTILDAQSGAVVGKVGGNKFDSVNPSLSPDGSQVAFERDASGNPGKTFGVWAANTSGSHLHRLARVGEQPMWSPTSDRIAYVVFGGKSVPLRLVSAGGGKSRTLVRSVSTVFGWSPDGKSIAFETGAGKLAVVDVASHKVSTLRRLRNAQTAVWSPDSSELLANTVSAKCWSTWRVPANGSAPTRISSCH